MEMKRNINCDLMRVVSMLFVIAIHVERSFIKVSFLETVLSTILYTCNGMFFMLSGRFTLKKEFSCAED